MKNNPGKTVYVTLTALVAALGGLLFGYDTAVISGAVGFLKDYFNLTPAMTGWAASSALVGCMVGAALAGMVSDRIGRKKRCCWRRSASLSPPSDRPCRATRPSSSSTASSGASASAPPR